MNFLKEKSNLFALNQRGNLLLYYLIVLLGLIFISMIILFLVPEARIVMALILAFSIYMNVRGSIGDGMPTLIITAILVYFLVFKYFFLSSGLFIISMVIAYSGASLISWGARYLFWKGPQ
ncbi:hypothetical protein KKE06_05895 [Candidatus Micrarchaeota archaeon]|nr:hypothetical protein [Candidatus Micrarchaeota archaeon]MBU1930701.1 hypothetical protein [Candidatus Micrarchaeota archaeon]